MLTIYNICNYQDFQLSIISIIFDLYESIKNLSDDIYNADEVDEYNNIVRMFNTLFTNNNEITIKIIDKINSYFINDVYINKYYNYYPENQLSYELTLFSKFYNQTNEMNENGMITMPTDCILNTITNIYNLNNDDLFDTSDASLINGLSQVDLILGFSDIVKTKYVCNSYGDYYSNSINKYVQSINKIVTKYGYQIYYEDDIDTLGDDSFLNIDVNFNNINDIIDSRFMTYNLNYIKKNKFIMEICFLHNNFLLLISSIAILYGNIFEFKFIFFIIFNKLIEESIFISFFYF